MADVSRPMRRAKREVKDPEELKAILERAQILRIGYTDAEGMAIVPMNYGFDWDTSVADSLPTLWVHCAGDGRKSDAWAANSTVALEVDADLGVLGGDYACAYTLAYESIMAVGTITKAESKEDKIHGLTALMQHAAPSAPVTFSDAAVREVAIWRIDVTGLTGKHRS